MLDTRNKEQVEGNDEKVPEDIGSSNRTIIEAEKRCKQIAMMGKKAVLH